MNKKNITRHPGVRNLVKVEKNNWTCFDYCCWDCPCDACTTYGEIQPKEVDEEEEAKADYEAELFNEERKFNS